MRTVDGSFAVITYNSKYNPRITFIFKNRGLASFDQYTTHSSANIININDFKVSTPIQLIEVNKKKKSKTRPNNSAGEITVGQFIGVRNTLQESEILVFTSNIIPGQWKLYSRLTNGFSKAKEYYIMRIE